MAGSLSAGATVHSYEMPGYVIDLTDTTSNTTTTTVEFATTSVAFTALLGARYKVTYRGASESSVAGDAMTCRLRWKNTASVDTSGAEFARSQTYADTLNHTFANVNLFGVISGQTAGTVTVVATILRASGTGNVKQNATASPLYFLIELI